MHELIKSASNPQDVVKAFLQAEQNADIQARLFRLQGESGKAAEVEAKCATEFFAVNGAAKLGQVAESLMKRVSTAWVAAEGSSGAKGTGQALREVEVSSGGKGRERRNSTNRSRTQFIVGGNKTYQTDSLGRIDKVESNLSLTRNDRNTYQQCVAGKCGVSSDEAGHLIAVFLMGQVRG
ncbi:DNA/RNA non-specific endonuclease [Pseudomonas urethralis]|uniref:DNA/RNA non-specific endonuclease n=1 Tax=Pseudomonas urethralis TaxID=2740517 RepID=UPI001C685B06|nr:DNA/RNA non-specific endonuclease [Pseudomonas urethralis]